MGVNRTLIIGNAGGDPEARYTQNGKMVCELSVAVNERYGESETTTWFKVICWERLAETVAEYVRKGREICVEGAMRERSYDDKDGNKRYVWELIANNVTFLSGGRTDDAGGGGTRQERPAAGGGAGRGPARAPARTAAGRPAQRPAQRPPQRPANGRTAVATAAGGDVPL